MKHILTLLVPFIFCCTGVYSQDSKEKVFSCNQGAVDDEHSSDSTFNALIDLACREINHKNYEYGLKLLNEAILKDSIYSASSGGVANEYIKAQRNKLRIFIDNQKLDQSEKQNETRAQDDPQVNENTQSQSNIVTEEKPQTSQASPDPAPVVVSTGAATADVVEKTEEKAPETKKAEEEDPFSKKEEPPAAAEEIKTFSKEELEEFQMKGMQKVKTLEMYIIQVASQNTTAPDADAATESAIALFDSEERSVEVSSLSGQSKLLKVRKYFQKLRMLPYDKITIEWADLQYTSDFRLGVDGNYHGYIIFRQRFVAENDMQVVYKDLTTKKTEVVLKSYSKNIEGQAIENWDVFLGDIRVQQTEAN